MTTINQASYIKRALDSNSKWTIIRSVRRSGRTLLSLEWALRESNKKVAVITPFNVADVFKERIEEKYNGLISLSNHTMIHLKNRTSIRFLKPEDLNNTRGTMLDHIIIEEAGYIKFDPEIMHFLNAYSSFGTRVLVTASVVQEDSLFRWLEENEKTDAYYEEYSYLDAIEDNADAQGYSEIKSMCTPYTFQQEYGPWNTINKYGEQKNKKFKHLLNKRGV